MLILSRVCAEFHDARGNTLLSVRPENLLSFLEAPEEIRADPLFRLMLADGSLEAVRSVGHRRALEADPAAGTDAEGRKPAAEQPSDPAPRAAAAAPSSERRSRSARKASADADPDAAPSSRHD